MLSDSYKRARAVFNLFFLLFCALTTSTETDDQNRTKWWRFYEEERNKLKKIIIRESANFFFSCSHAPPTSRKSSQHFMSFVICGNFYTFSRWLRCVYVQSPLITSSNKSSCGKDLNNLFQFSSAQIYYRSEVWVERVQVENCFVIFTVRVQRRTSALESYWQFRLTRKKSVNVICLLEISPENVRNPLPHIFKFLHFGLEPQSRLSSIKQCRTEDLSTCSSIAIFFSRERLLLKQ